MGTEIERKFLVRGDDWRTQVERRAYISQGYLNRDGGVVVRVRVIDESGLLSIKAATASVARAEFEYPIPVADARRLLEEFALAGRIDKVRNYVNYSSYLFEIDEFIETNTGLVIAEVELSDVNEEFPRPQWLGTEVTGQRRYYNAALAARPYNTWAEAEKAEGEN
jgi:adenylate cyclase